MATIEDVAAAAGVSIATVSRVVNGQGKVAPETAARVRAAVAALDFHPNRVARNLRRGQTGIILILTPNMTNPFYANILSGIGDTATAQGYAAFTCITGEDESRAREALVMLDQRRADGAILLSENGDPGLAPEFAARHPVVQCCEFEPGNGLTHVAIDNYGAARDVMGHFLGLGHSRIGHISSVNDYLSTRLRLAAYRDALAEAGWPPRDEDVACGAYDYAFASGKAAATALLTSPDPPTALFCISDTLGMGALVGAQELGLRVPEDVSITGFDNVVEATMLRPHLTSLEQPCRDIGVAATTALLGLIGGTAPEPEIVLPHRLVVRASTGPALTDRP
jgi:DNA-binding LacI/PurR family transcriptional regulator